MKVGIYYSYWEKEWDVDVMHYVKKVHSLGFDVCEIAAAGLLNLTDAQMAELKKFSEDTGFEYSTCIGLPKQYNVASPYESTRQAGLAHMRRIMDAMNKIGSKVIVGITFAYWPVNYFEPFDKDQDWKQSVKSVKELADYAAKYDITLTLEVVNRFEQYMFNDAAECIKFIKEVGKPNVKQHLDSFHMNIEEDSIVDALRASKGYIGHYHIGEPNRKPPREGSRMDWPGQIQALKDAEYDGYVVMEPFVMKGGQVGADIKVYRDLWEDNSESFLDSEIKKSLAYIKSLM